MLQLFVFWEWIITTETTQKKVFSHLTWEFHSNRIFSKPNPSRILIQSCNTLTIKYFYGRGHFKIYSFPGEYILNKKTFASKKFQNLSHKFWKLTFCLFQAEIQACRSYDKATKSFNFFSFLFQYIKFHFLQCQWKSK